MKEIDSLYFTKKKELANREFKYFDGADENCQAFNNEQMWNMEQVNSYNGFSGLDSRNIRGFHNASGCGAGYNASGGVNPQVNRKSRRGSVDRISANPVRGMGMNASGRSARRGGRDRISTQPVRGVGREIGYTDCGGKCGHHNGQGPCPDGCKCSSTYNGICESTRIGTAPNELVRKMNFSAPARGFSPVERVFPYGTGNYFSGGSARDCGLDRR